MFSSPIAKPQPPQFPSSEVSHSHLTLSLLSTQAFSSVQASSINHHLDFPFTVPSRSTSLCTPAKDICIDRFIPVRSDPVKKKLLFDIQQESTQIEEEPEIFTGQKQSIYHVLLEEQVLGLPRSQMHEEETEDSFSQNRSLNRLLNFKNPNREDKTSSSNGLNQTYFPFTFEKIISNSNNNIRKIPDKPCRVLEAPYLEDDYYLNLLDWSNSNFVAVALRDTIYLWSGIDGLIRRMSQMEGMSNIYSSVGWDTTGDFLATGISNGKIEIWDLHKMRVVRDDLEDHSGRVGCLGWNSRDVLASGSMDNCIFLRDMRIGGVQSTVMKLRGHRYEVCGLKWSPNNFQLASGGNDNKLFIWNVKKGTQEAKFGDHKAAVKALTWSPHQSGLLLSGGGNNDKTIKFWNTLTMKNIKSIYTASQVCNLVFSKNSNEFVSTHGFNNNHVIIWKYPELSKVSILEGHTSRVLYLGLSPDGETICTGAGAADETLRFWTVFPPIPQCESSTLMPNSTYLR